MSRPCGFYAAEHDGKLPAQLADIKLPLDPMIGRPFLYQLKVSTASIHGAPAPGLEKLAHINIRYEVTITKP